MNCPLCDASFDGMEQYPNLVCDDCDEQAVNADGEVPWFGWPPGESPEQTGSEIRPPPDNGENPVFVDGEKCWRRYRFGGWVTMHDTEDCATLEEFYDEHSDF